MYTSASNFVCGVTEPGLQITMPRSTSSFFMPRSRRPTLSPAWPSSRIFRNISTPVHTVFCVSRMPTSSTLSPVCTTPRSIRPVATVPRPEIENTSSTGIRNGLSRSRCGSGMYVSRASSSSKMHFASALSASPLSSALSALPRMIGVLSPGNSYWSRSSRTSISTRSSSSGSSTMSHLFMNTMMYGTPT